MVENMKENGKLIIWKDMEFISGMMAGNTKENTKMIKSMGMVFINGQMEDNTLDTGTKENSMV